MQKRPYIKFISVPLPEKYPLSAKVGNCRIPEAAGELSFEIHSCTEIVYCRSGHGHAALQNEILDFCEGDVLFFSPYMLHRLYHDPGEACICEFIHLDPAGLFDPAIFQDLIQTSLTFLEPFSVAPVIHADDAPVLAELIRQMMEELEHSSAYIEMSIKGYCMAMIEQLALLHRLNSPVAPGTESAKSLLPALIYMNQSYPDSVTIAELADMCGMSLTYFRRRFKSVFSMSPLQYLDYTRIRQSCILLTAYHVPISEVAEKVGFKTLSTYNRNFRSVMGQTPSEYAKYLRSLPSKPEITHFD